MSTKITILFIGIAVVLGIAITYYPALAKEEKKGIWDWIRGTIDCVAELNRCYLEGEKCVKRVKGAVTQCDDRYEKSKERCKRYQRYGEKSLAYCEKRKAEIQPRYLKYLERCDKNFNECKSSAEKDREKYPERYPDKIKRCNDMYRKCKEGAEESKKRGEQRYQQCLDKAQKRIEGYRERERICENIAKDKREYCKKRILIRIDNEVQRCDRAKDRCIRRLEKKCP